MAHGEKIKRFFSKIKPFVRGLLKSLPFGSAVVEIADNVKHEIQLGNDLLPKRSVTETDPTTGEVIVKPPHSWLSIAIQLLTLIALIYAFYTKAIPITDVIEFLKKLQP